MYTSYVRSRDESSRYGDGHLSSGRGGVHSYQSVTSETCGVYTEEGRPVSTAGQVVRIQITDAFVWRMSIVQLLPGVHLLAMPPCGMLP